MIRGSTQIKTGSIYDAQLSASANISTDKLAEGALLLKKDGSVPLTADLDFNNHRPSNLLNPLLPQDAATKSYVDALTTGVNSKASVRTVASGNVTSFGVQTISGVSLNPNDRVGLIHQADPKENGIYVVASSAWSRSADADNTPNAEFTKGLYFSVSEGAFAGKEFICVSPNTTTIHGIPAINLGVDNINFEDYNSVFTGSGNVDGGNFSSVYGGIPVVDGGSF